MPYFGGYKIIFVVIFSKLVKQRYIKNVLHWIYIPVLGRFQVKEGIINWVFSFLETYDISYIL